MWIVVWAFFAVIILGTFGWSLLILQQQKKAWEDFAKKANLNYKPGKFMESPSVTGLMNGRKLSVFSAEQQIRDARSQRFVTVIELELGTGLPAAAAIGSKEYSNFLAPLQLDEQWTPPEGTEWPAGALVKTKNREALARYMTAERIKSINGILSMKSSIALFFFDDMEGVLRIETSDPLRDLGHMEKIVKRLMKDMDILAPTPEEKKKTGRKKDAEEDSAAGQA